jgi:Calx-beta domain
VDDDVWFSIADSSVSEAGGTMTFTVTKTGTATQTHAVSYATANGTATAGSDYTAKTGTLSFGIAAVTKTITVSITNDSTYEGDEALLVNLSTPTNGAGIADGSATGTVIEDDPSGPPGTLQFTAASTSVSETSGSVTLTVSRTNGSAGAASVVCATVDGTATASPDYTAVSTTLSWSSGETTSKSCTVPIVNDTLHEGYWINVMGSNVWIPVETFSATLSGAMGATLGAQTSESVSITDND